MSSAIDLIFTTSPVEARMYAILTDVLTAKKSVKAAKAAKVAVKADAAVWLYVQEHAKKIVSKSIKSSSGAPAHLKAEWREFEGESVLFEKVAEYAQAFNSAYQANGEKAVEAFAVTTLQRAFIAYVKSEQSGGVLTKDSVVDDYSSYSTVSIHADDEDKELEIADDTFSVDADDFDAELSFDDVKDFVVANASRYHVLLDVFALETGLMRRYTIKELAHEAVKLAKELEIDFDIIAFCDAVQSLRVLKDIKSGTVKNKLGLKDREAVKDAIKIGVLNDDDLTSARQRAFFEYAHTNKLLNGFCVEAVEFCSIDDMINAAVLSVVENRKGSLDVVAELICEDLTRQNDIELQKAKRDFMQALTGQAQKQDLVADASYAHVQMTEQAALF